MRDHPDLILAESPVEVEFGYHLHKYADPRLIECQKTVVSRHGEFRFNFFVDYNEYRVAIECDGKEFHDANRDEYRDAVVLGYDLADVVYRIPGSSICRSTEACLYAMSLSDPNIFTDRGIQNLANICRYDEVIRSNERYELIYLRLDAEGPEARYRRNGPVLTRRAKRDAKRWQHLPSWKRIYEYESTKDGQLDDIINGEGSPWSLK